MEELGFEEEDEPIDPPGSLRPLVEYVSMGTLTDRIGPDRMPAFVTKLREEGPGPGDVCYYYFRKAALLGRYAALKYENVALLEQAHRDAAEARAGEARYQKWRGEPPLPDDTPPDEID